jgi:predicted Fe-Mo cluster-binding NifX family protein
VVGVRKTGTPLWRRIKVMLRIAVPTNNGEQISEQMTRSLLFLIYETNGEKIKSVTKRAQTHGILAAVEDCHLVLSRNCPEPIRELLGVKGVRTIKENRNNAQRAVLGVLKKENVKKRILEKPYNRVAAV